MKRSIGARLRALKHQPEFGGMDEVAKLRMKRKLWDAIGLDPSDNVNEPIPGYVTWVFSQYISKPILAGVFSLVVITGGWLTSVRAADSLPGETWYSIKLITEQAQLKLVSLDKKAVLHTVFAERRLQEIVDLQESSTDQSKTAPLVSETIQAYKQEVASAAENLQQLRAEGDINTLATASSVQENLQAINGDFANVVADSATPEATQEVLDAQAVTQEVADAATTVVVEVHEQGQSELSAIKLKEIFLNDLGEIEARRKFDLTRLDVIREALNDATIDYTNFSLPSEDDLLGYEYQIKVVDAALSDTMNEFAAGGYRSAFAHLNEIDQTLLDAEASLAEIEIMIMTARVQVPGLPPPDDGSTNTDTEL